METLTKNAQDGLGRILRPNVQHVPVAPVLARPMRSSEAIEQAYWTIEEMPVGVLAWKIANREEYVVA